jgi:cytochrome c-type biogenesis protein CcmH/NrfG
MVKEGRVAAHKTVAALALIVTSMPVLSRADLSSAEELVRQAHAHEAVHEDDLALRRYTEALTIDPTSVEAWLGLGGLRMRLGEAAEAERVYMTALERVPSMHRALQGRARARWVLGRHSEAEVDLDAYATMELDPGALRELASWFGADRRTPAQLATWRRLLAFASESGDAALEREARRMVRALVILVDSADPASSPMDADATRRALAVIARRGG